MTKALNSNKITKLLTCQPTVARLMHLPREQLEADDRVDDDDEDDEQCDV